jgi:hypothetical protein
MNPSLWFEESTRIFFRGPFKSLDQFSNLGFVSSEEQGQLLDPCMGEPLDQNPAELSCI